MSDDVVLRIALYAVCVVSWCIGWYFRGQRAKTEISVAILETRIAERIGWPIMEIKELDVLKRRVDGRGGYEWVYLPVRDTGVLTGAHVRVLWEFGFEVEYIKEREMYKFTYGKILKP